MASGKKMNHEQLLLGGLRYAVHGLTAPFACGGTFVPKHPSEADSQEKTFGRMQLKRAHDRNSSCRRDSISRSFNRRDER
jgi:hypothetical protein